MTVDLIVNIIDLLIWVGLFLVIFKINKRLTTIEQADSKTDKLLEWVDRNSFDISKAVKDVKETFEDFHINYVEVGKMLDSLNCPIYKFVFGKDNEVVISYDFKTVTMKFNTKTVTYTDWTLFKNDFIDALSISVEFKNEPYLKLDATVEKATDKEFKETSNTIDVAGQLVEDLKPKRKPRKKKDSQ